MANLYGAETPLEALAKLAAQRERLRKEAAKLAPDLEKAEQVYATITGNVQAGHVYGGGDRRDIDWMFRLRERIRKRIAKIKTDLARIEKDGAAIRKHCNASQAEIQTAIRRYKKQLDDAEMATLGAAFRHHEAKEELRRLSPFGCRGGARKTQGYFRAWMRVIGAIKELTNTDTPEDGRAVH